jgi:hypothetical protein
MRLIKSDIIECVTILRAIRRTIFKSLAVSMKTTRQSFRYISVFRDVMNDEVFSQ